ncbi:hypothetical protein OAK05_01020 [Gammaproteobacteria bacterium]|nr:hypothetical protein [Gammaproteobacteria bacterium]
MKIDKSIVETKISDKGETIRSLRALGLPRAVYDELSKNDEPDLTPYELCILGNLIDVEPLDLIGPEDVAVLMKTLLIASENSTNDELDPHLIITASLDTIKTEFHAAAANSSAEIDIKSRQHLLNGREIAEWGALKGSKHLQPKIGWISLLPEGVLIDIAEKLKLFEAGMINLTMNKMKMSEKLSSLDTLVKYAEAVNSSEQLDELFIDERYEIFYKRLERPLVFSEISADYVQTPAGDVRPEEEHQYDYELQPLITRHCFIVAPKQNQKSKGCLIFNAARKTVHHHKFTVDLGSSYIDAENWHKHKKQFISKEEPGD